MIIKKIKTETRRRGKETSEYIRDAAGAENGEVFGAKTSAAHGMLNCMNEKWEDAAHEIAVAEKAYCGPGNPVSHWIIAWDKNEKPTAEQEKEAWEVFLKHQGMSDHMLVFVGHDNTDNYHSHALICRLKSEADKDGNYRIQHFGASETKMGTDNKQRNHEINSAHRAVAEICEKQGWSTNVNIYNEDGTKKQRIVDADKIRLGQRIEALEARIGEPSAQRIAAEKAVECLRSAKNWEEARTLCDKANLTLHITDSRGIDDKVRWGGYIKDDVGNKVKFSALPKDCSYRALDKRFEVKETQVKAPKTLTANSAKYHARNAFNTSTNFNEAIKLLSDKNLSVEREGKSGAYLRFAEGDEGRIKLSALGGKYSLSALTKKYADYDHILSSKHTTSIPSTNATVKKDASKSASAYAERANDRVSNANERAADVAAEGIQAKTLSEALDDAFQQAFANDAVRKAKNVAAEATKRAEQAEKRLEQQSENDMKKERSEIDFNAQKTKLQNSIASSEKSELKNEATKTLAERVAEAKAKGAFKNTGNTLIHKNLHQKNNSAVNQSIHQKQ